MYCLGCGLGEKELVCEIVFLLASKIKEIKDINDMDITITTNKASQH
jgi:hypothetical protein